MRAEKWFYPYKSAGYKFQLHMYYVAGLISGPTLKADVICPEERGAKRIWRLFWGELNSYFPFLMPVIFTPAGSVCDEPLVVADLELGLKENVGDTEPMAEGLFNLFKGVAHPA
jgi:hypothetical protein